MSSAKEIAEPTTILRAVVGSTVHGLALEGTDDRDEMGVCVEPPEYVIGLRKFEQWVGRTQPEGVRSGPGDLDVVVYSLRKWARLALAGNPTVLLLLFSPDVVFQRDAGVELQASAALFASRRAGYRFAGYMRAQRERLLGLRGQKRTKRPELDAEYGYDTKYAMHMLRLGYQGVEFLETGRISLPMPEDDREFLRAVRVGDVRIEDVIDEAAQLERKLGVLTNDGPLPEHPDVIGVERFLLDTYSRAWELATVA